MKTRRAFIKSLLGFGAIILPWSLLPNRFAETLKVMLGRPPVTLVLPPEAKSKNDDLNYEILNRTALDDIYALTAPEMQGRKAGSVGESKAAEYLSSQLSMLGLRPMGDLSTGFIQAFTIPPVIETRVNGRLTFRPGDNKNLRFPSVNLIGELMGEKTEEIILLSAHYDHLGIFEGEVYPGANDNASGVGCVLDVIRRITRESETPKRTIVVAFWSAEEMGFVGSQAFLHSPTVPLKQIVAVLNADTVGNGMIGNFALWGEGENIAVTTLKQAAAESGASAQLTPRGGHNSDSVSFGLAGIPAATLLAQEWLYKNHTPEDTLALIKSEQVYLATEILYKAVRRLAF
ncbi:putative aminopeptidase [Desulfosporosinus orientis DSM 765]|uniref:Putative aminopeptidase n=1 Tax=Desulfosporosinus orientis (strain ATCC 19365 / DSM 765 / NCIMB 8382 / VKM B-1628 / Singapore I) TaxID=768706 RepID=G7WI24_DESOD|nr:M20/M25/M40 family metallo-hydrolase [Desulfosporosinus orientis]AET70321.1 putative aminopeptidase [Desulfosporosinus orientis DSM 765]